MKTKFILALSVFLIHALSAAAQVPAEFAVNSMSAPIPNGPATTTLPARLLQNASGTTYTAPNTTVNVTASTSNQQYTGVNTGTGNPVLFFGGSNNAGSNSPLSVPTFDLMSVVGSPANENYSNTTAGTATGIDVTANYAFNLYTSVHQWNGSSVPSVDNVRIQMADLTLTFSSPVTNPYLHFSGVAGVTGALGFATEFDLLSTVTATGTVTGTLTKIQGNSALAVSATQINSGVAVRNASCATNAAGCGTVRVNGSNIISITFRVYIKGDNGKPTWGTTGNHGGDRWSLGVSLPETYSISGSVFNDVNGSTNSAVDGTPIGSPGGIQLYANLVDPTDNSVLGSVAVNNTDGTYSFVGVPANTNARVEISTAQGVALTAAPAKTLPTGWVNTGESLGDITPDGALTVAVAAADVTGANFGIEQRPTANNNTAAIRNNPGGTNRANVPATTFSASDPSPGTVTNIRITAFPTNATSITVGTATYYPNAGAIPGAGTCPTASCAVFPAAGITIPTNGSGNPTQTIQVDPSPTGATTVSISYVAIDNAGVESAATATASVPFTLGLTAADGNIAGTLYFNGTPLRRALVVLIDAASNSKIFARTDQNGKYLFEDRNVGRTYLVKPLSSKYSFSPATAVVNLNGNAFGQDFNSSAKIYRPKNDFDGDGQSDVAVYRPTDGNWYVLRSSDGQFSAFQFGTETDTPVAADYDGDGRTDYAVFRPSEGNWYVWQSSAQQMRVERFGLAADKLIPADYDGDGKADVAVYRGGVWYIRRSSDGALEAKTYGAETDTPLAGDFDGDGKADKTVFRASEGVWFTLRSSDDASFARAFGLATDTPLVGDFDGDGVADIAQYRNGYWFVLNSTTDFEASLFGAGEDQSIVGDYDGDGRADTTVFRDGSWSIRNSGDGNVRNLNFGLPTDVLIR